MAHKWFLLNVMVEIIDKLQYASDKSECKSPESGILPAIKGLDLIAWQSAGDARRKSFPHNSFLLIQYIGVKSFSDS